MLQKVEQYKEERWKHLGNQMRGDSNMRTREIKRERRESEKEEEKRMEVFMVRPRKRDEEIRKIKKGRNVMQKGVCECECVCVWIVLKMHTKESQRAD